MLFDLERGLGLRNFIDDVSDDYENECLKITELPGYSDYGNLWEVDVNE